MATNGSPSEGRSTSFLRIIMHKFNSLPKGVLLTVLIAPVLLLISAYYLWIWESVDSFVIAVDHSNQLFQDFLGHYYPRGRTILHITTPVPGYFYSAIFAL